MSNQAQDLLVSRQFNDILINAEDGISKEASASSTKVTRTKVYEEAFSRVIQPYTDISNDDLDYSGDPEWIGKWFDIETDVPRAQSVPFNTTPNTFIPHQETYAVIIHVIRTDEVSKNIDQLRNYRTDMYQLVTDSMMREIHYEEDSSWIAHSDRVVGSQVNYGSATPEDQNIDMGAATMTRKNLKWMLQWLTDRQLPLHVSLVNQSTANELLTMDRNELGGDLAQDFLKDGLKAMEKLKIFGHSFLATNKNDLVPNGTMYQYTEPGFLGQALRLEDITVTLEKKNDIVRWRAQERVGRAIGNTWGIQKLKFSLGGVELP